MLRSLLAAAVLAILPVPLAAAEDPFAGRPWPAVAEAARGQEVRFFLWGGDDRINAFVSGWVAERAAESLGITVTRVGIADTAEAVNLILSERQAGMTEGGSVDLVWINGENFRTLKENGLIACGWAERLPNAALVDWTDPSVATDFGVPVEGCEAPWSRAQFAFATDTARVAQPPRAMAALLDWIRAHPGRFTYAAPPDFNGSAFVRHVFVHVAGGSDALAGPFDQAAFDAVAPKAWALLNDLKPSLWREGATYPTSIAQLNQLFANGEVDFTFNYEPTAFGSGVEAGVLPPTTISFGLDDGTVANTSYLAIPSNAANRDAALVLADFLTGVEAQLEKAKPEVWGMAPAIDLDRLPPTDAAAFRALPRHPAVIAPEVLADTAMPELGVGWVEAIEAGWIANVGRGG
jgi:putative spermidine/putrescine transport system substrate-binding protein